MLALKNSYPREDRGHRLLLDCELATTREDNHRQAELEEAPTEIGVVISTGWLPDRTTAQRPDRCVCRIPPSFSGIVSVPLGAPETHCPQEAKGS